MPVKPHCAVPHGLRRGLHQQIEVTVWPVFAPIVEPNTFIPLTRWLNAISRMRLRCSERASDGRMTASVNPGSVRGLHAQHHVGNFYTDTRY